MQQKRAIILTRAIYCDESAASPLIISTPRPLIAALHQAPDGSGCVREEGRWNSQVWRRVMRHTWRKWSLITAAVICRLRLSSGDRSLPRACTLVSSWVQEGCVEGAAAAPVHGWRARMPGRIIPGGAVARRRKSRWRSRRPSRSGPERGARAAAGLRPLPGPFLPEHCPSFTIRVHNEDTRPPVYFGHFIPLGHFYCIISV